MKSLSPFHSLALLVVLAAACSILCWAWPKGGFALGSYRLKFASLNWGEDSTQIKLDFLAHMARLDSIAQADSLRALNDTVRVERTNSLMSLQFKDGNSACLHPFFEALDSAAFKNIDVLHFGDSQIECDRMTQILRAQLQAEFGGYGPGLIAPVPLVASSHIVQTQSTNWKRCTAYGFHDTKVSHTNFGVMCSFGKFDTPSTTDSTMATLELMPTRFGEARNKTYHVMRLYYRNPETTATLRVFANDILVWHGAMAAHQEIAFEEIQFAATPAKIKLQFTAMKSPEIHAIQLEEPVGVSVSNIALRGSDGLVFTRTDLQGLGQTLHNENPQLIILQFGGNSVPYIKSTAHAQSVAAQMALQVKALRKQCPSSAFLIVGPSDMSTSIEGTLQTFPHLPTFNDALKSVALDNDCAYWDMYAVMGGRNSMLSWVSHQPPYAGPDYTHFTPLGARKMGEFLSKAILEEYRMWKNAQLNSGTERPKS